MGRRPKFENRNSPEVRVSNFDLGCSSDLSITLSSLRLGPLEMDGMHHVLPILPPRPFLREVILIRNLDQ